MVGVELNASNEVPFPQNSQVPFVSYFPSALAFTPLLIRSFRVVDWHFIISGIPIQGKGISMPPQAIVISPALNTSVTWRLAFDFLLVAFAFHSFRLELN